MNNIKKKWLVFLFFSLTIYAVFNATILVYLFGKYYFIDIKSIEPKNYSFDIKYIQETTGVNKTVTNTHYYQHINNIGTRNSFDVSKEDRNIVILLGDSFFFGVGLNDDETFSHFLNQIDTKRKYINLALPGANVYGSVENYFQTCKEIASPAFIIFEILFVNDIYASEYVTRKIRSEIDNVYRYVAWPFHKIFGKNIMFVYCVGKTEKKVAQDLSDRRFIEYIIKPLNRLMSLIYQSRTKVIIISYTYSGKDKTFKNYNERLMNYCFKTSIYFFTLDEFIDFDTYKNERLPDGHPSANFNRILAEKIKNKIDELALN